MNFVCERSLLAKRDKVNLLNLWLHNITRHALLRDLKKGIVLTPNINHLVMLQKDSEFYDVYQKADYVLCDSQILFFILKMLNTPVREKISGADLLSEYCKYNINSGIRIFLLGSADWTIAELARTRINNMLRREMVVDCYSPSIGFELNKTENDYIIKRITQSRANVVAIGVGAPKQEKWIVRYKSRLPSVNLFMGVGATIDFEAGVLKRAPVWMRSVGLEWLHRLSQEPGRLWRRYLLDGFFIFKKILIYKLGLYKNPWQ